MPKYVRGNRPIERAAVNAVTAFFDHQGCVVQPVHGENDVGKDAYVDLTDQRRVTGMVIAIQVKGGAQTRRATQGGEIRGIPFTRDDSDFYRSSRVPVIGIGFDEHDPGLHWVNLTDYCAKRYESGDSAGGFAAATGLLTDATWKAFVLEMQLAVRSSHFVGTLDLASDDPIRQSAAVSDCFGLGRTDPRAMLLLRRLLPTLHEDALMTALSALAHVTPHPDIAWTRTNWISGRVKDRIKQELSWTRRELVMLLTIVEEDNEDRMWGRAVFGEHITMLLLEDRELSPKLMAIVEDTGSPLLARFRALVYSIYCTKDDALARQLMEQVLMDNPDLRDDRRVRQLALQVQDYGWVDVF